MPSNSDVLIPYRLPVMLETHGKACETDGCLQMQCIRNVFRTLRQSMADQIGYISDYVTKRQPVCTKEIARFIKGHRQLQEKMRSEPGERAAVRHTQRLLSDVLGRGTARKAVECTNLIVCRKNHDVTAAESLKSHLVVPFPCSDYMRCEAVATTIGSE